MRIAATWCWLAIGAAPVLAQPTPVLRPPPTPEWTLELTNHFTSPGGSDVNQNETQARLTGHVNPRSTLFFEVDQPNRFSDLDSALLVGGGHAFGTKHLLLVSASLAFGFNAPTLIPKREYTVQGDVRATPHVSPVFEFQRSEYEGTARVNQLTVGLKVTPISKVMVQPAYINTTSVLAPNVTEVGHAFGLTASAPMTSKLALTFRGGYGHEHAMARRRTIVEVVRSLQQLSLGPGIAWQITPSRDLKLTYIYEAKKTKYAQHGFIADFSVGF